MEHANVQVIREDDHTFRIEDGHVRFFLLEGEEKALLIDSGIDTPDAKEIAMSLTEKPLMLLNTHGDGDHTSGNGAFSSYYIGEDDYLACNMAEKFPSAQPLFLEDGQLIDLGKRPLIICAIPGHTVGSVAILDENARTIYTGDSVSTAFIYMFGQHRSVAQYEKSLEKLNSLRDSFDVIKPSHGTPTLGSDAIALVLTELRYALKGWLPSEQVEVHGTRVSAYQGSFCGFYFENNRKTHISSD